MNKIVFSTCISVLLFACATPEPEEDFHPTDALLIGGNGGFNPTGEDGGADLGDFDSAAPEDEGPFHPTDALLIGGNGGFNPSAEGSGADLGGLDEEIYDK